MSSYTGRAKVQPHAHVLGAEGKQAGADPPKRLAREPRQEPHRIFAAEHVAEKLPPGPSDGREKEGSSRKPRFRRGIRP